jgi:hypothetical protein
VSTDVQDEQALTGEQIEAMDLGAAFAEAALWPRIRARIAWTDKPVQIDPAHIQDWWAGVFSMLAGAALAQCGPCASRRLIEALNAAMAEVESAPERRTQ